MAKSKGLRTAALMLILSMLAVACGQKEGVHNVGFDGGVASGGQGGAPVGDGGFDDDGLAFDPDVDGGFATDPDDDGTAGETGGGGGTTGGSGGGTTGGAGSGTPGTTGSGGTGGGTTGGSGGGTTGGGGGAAAPRGDSTGITAEKIKIGIHAPLSGAAPLPQASFNSGRDQYWRHTGKLHGRDVEVIIRDDQYNPSRATSVCNDLIQREQVFLLIGGGGTDQIAACARTAAQQGVPYLSAGVDEGVLRNLNNYFALSMSYLQQAPLLVQWVARNSPPPNNRFGILRDRTPGFNAVVNAVKTEAEKQGWEVHVRQHQNGPSDASWLTQHQIQVAFPIMAPSAFVQVVRSPGGSIGQWAGIGITMGLNTVANAACQGNPAYNGAMFFSPAPGLNQIDRLDPEFRRAGGSDDIELLLWGLNKSIHKVFEKMPANNLTRQSFVQALQTNTIETNVYPTLRHRPDNHFGASTVHVLVADCSRSQYVTPDNGIHRGSF